jgi:MYXO-CTERM domain-containing protein
MRILASLLCSFAFASTVSADVLSPPPPDCIPETMAIECHGAPTCRVVTCAGDGDCAPGFACVEVSLCVTPHSCGGRLIDPTYEHASAVCSPSMRCPSDDGTTCQMRRVCRAPGMMDAGGTDGGSMDSGTTSMDSGTTSMDSGTTSMDSGGGTRDSGGTTTTTDDGGCCSVTGSGGFVGAAIVAIAVVAFGFRGRRRR